VKREPFAGPGPWSIKRERLCETPDDDVAFLSGYVVGLDPDRGIISHVQCHAFCLTPSNERGEVAIQVGAGSGYYTAIWRAAPPRRAGSRYESMPSLRLAPPRFERPSHVQVHPQSGIADDLPRPMPIYVCAGLRNELDLLDAKRPGARCCSRCSRPEHLPACCS